MQAYQNLWEFEQQFWLQGPDFYEFALDIDAFMMLPPPVGILDRGATIAAITQGARWTSVMMSNRRVLVPLPDTAVLAYTVEANRGTAATEYTAQCSSTYCRHGADWKLVAHHQTPTGGGSGGRA